MLGLEGPPGPGGGGGRGGAGGNNPTGEPNGDIPGNCGGTGIFINASSAGILGGWAIINAGGASGAPLPYWIDEEGFMASGGFLKTIGDSVLLLCGGGLRLGGASFSPDFEFARLICGLGAIGGDIIALPLKLSVEGAWGRAGGLGICLIAGVIVSESIHPEGGGGGGGGGGPEGWEKLGFRDLCDSSFDESNTFCLLLEVSSTMSGCRLMGVVVPSDSGLFSATKEEVL